MPVSSQRDHGVGWLTQQIRSESDRPRHVVIRHQDRHFRGYAKSVETGYRRLGGHAVGSSGAALPLWGSVIRRRSLSLLGGGTNYKTVVANRCFCRCRRGVDWLIDHGVSALSLWNIRGLAADRSGYSYRYNWGRRLFLYFDHARANQRQRGVTAVPSAMVGYRKC